MAAFVFSETGFLQAGHGLICELSGTSLLPIHAVKPYHYRFGEE